MIRWLQAVLPPWWAVLAATACYFGLEFLCLSAEWRLDLPYYSLDVEKSFLGLMGFFTAFYAIYRVWAFHPALRPGYRNWLAATPWTSRKPLPLGPVHLVLQDVLFMGAAVALCWPRCGMKSLIVLQSFLFGYVVMLSLLHVYTGQGGWAYAVALGLGFMGLFVPTLLFYVAAGFTYAIAIFGLRASLAHFPWEDLPQFQQTSRTGASAQSQHRGILGWPFDRLGPGFPDDIPFMPGYPMFIALLAGWWFFVVVYRASPYDFENRGALFVSSAFLVVCTLGRIGIYCDGYLPPMSLRARVALGQLIIPGYDQAFVAPLLAVLAFLAVRTLPLWVGVSELIALPIGVTATWWILFGMGPTLKAWRLTGNHRIGNGLFKTQGPQNR